MKSLVVCFLGVWILNCGEAAVSSSGDSFQRMALSGTHVMAVEITSPHRIDFPRSGTVLLEVGNPGGAPVTLNLDHGDKREIEVAQRHWEQIQLRTESSLTLTWEGGPLQLGSWYLKPTQKQKKPNVLLVSVDTLRWDRFNHKSMPGLSKLFTEGKVFNQTYSPAPWTLPSHASMLSGQYPARHGVRKSDERMSQEVTTLAEVLVNKGYYTWAVTEGNFVSGRYGLNQGFHRYSERPPAMMSNDPEKVTMLRGSLDLIRRQLKRLGDVPQFLFLHTYEVHCPYLPHGDLQDAEGMGQTQWLLDHDGDALPAETLNHLRALYDGEVAFTDELLTPFLTGLWKTGDWLIVFTSDHGEEFGDHGGLLHGDTLYQEALHVPLAMIGPDLQAGTVNQPCSLVDIGPTILDYLDATPQPERWQGRSLLGASPKVPVFAESFFWGVHIEVDQPRLVGVLDSDVKLVQRQNFGKTEAELYDLASDPLERKNLISVELAKRDNLFTLIQAYLANKPMTPEQRESLTPEQLEALRALGYVD